MSPARFDSENDPERSPSPSISSPKRRPSIERLQQASRVRNSNIFALENKDAYDPNNLPIVERPSANRPLSQSFANNSFTRFDSLKKENSPLRSPQRPGHKRGESTTYLPLMSPSITAPAGLPLPPSPEKQGSPSPTKSSLARTSKFGLSEPSFFDPESGAWSDEERAPTPRAMHRHAKSVTFHEEPPVVNEYEQQTPEPSLSVASDREGSWDSQDFEDQDISFDRGSSADPERDDSFDADLENADKTPVVLPEDWSRMSPDEARTDLVNSEDDVFEEAEEEATQRPTLGSRIASDSSDSRPLPPLPAFMRQERRGSDSLTSAAERAAQFSRNVPSPPKRASCSKDDILKMAANSSLTLQDRLQLMGNGNSEERPDSKSSHSTITTHEEELVITNLDTGQKLEVNVAETEVQHEVHDDADLDALAHAPPRISRESILRKVRNTKWDFEDEDEADEEDDGSPARPTIAELARMDPDQPVPSRENSREKSDHFQDEHLLDAHLATAYVEEHEEEVVIKPEPTEDDGFDMTAIPAAVQTAPESALRSPSHTEDYDRQSSVLRHDNAACSASEEDDDNDNDSASRYSSVEPDAESTLLHAPTHQEEADDGKETLDEAMQLLTVKDYSSEVFSSASEREHEPTKQGSASEFMGLPTYLLGTDDLDFGMSEYITPPGPSSTSTNERQTQKLEEMKMPTLQPPVDFHAPHTCPEGAPYAEYDVSPPGTPESVIHHDDGDMDGCVSPIEGVNGMPEPALPRERQFVPERIASIKTGGKLKARPSATPADFESMAEQRRLVSAEHPVPPLPQVYRAEVQNAREASAGAPEDGEDTSVYSQDQDEPPKADSPVEKTPNRRKSRKSGGRMDLMLDTSAFSLGDDLDITEGDGLGLDEEFDKVIEHQKVGVAFPPPLFARFEPAASQASPAQRQQQHYIHSLPSPYAPHTRAADTGANGSVRTQKGYLMRQNTKVVVASNRNFSGYSDETITAKSPPMSPRAATGMKGGNGSQRKPSEEQFLKTEPWNGKARRKSVRNASAQKTQAYRSEPAPPLPGQESALGVVDEDYAAGTSTLEDDVGEGVERGRLFVKVVGVKDLDLPMPRNDRVDFQLTLDNGLHCVTTSSLELGRSAPIGQEFELVVLNDLEFQLTLTTKLPPPPPATAATPTPSSPTKSSFKSSKSSGFSRFLSSPKKRAEKERLEREAWEAEERRIQEEEARRKRASHAPTTWDLLHELVNAQDGSFARAYVNLKSHEKACFGRQLTVDVPCYNEWALENDRHVVNSVRSKRGQNCGPVRRPPYVVGKLELQLLYVPKPKGATDEDMPKSMSGAVREMKKAGEVEEVVHEGHLSQQGGDCAVSLHHNRPFEPGQLEWEC